jgi:hypothetical protein
MQNAELKRGRRGLTQRREGAEKSSDGVSSRTDLAELPVDLGNEENEERRMVSHRGAEAQRKMRISDLKDLKSQMKRGRRGPTQSREVADSAELAVMQLHLPTCHQSSGCVPVPSRKRPFPP